MRGQKSGRGKILETNCSKTKQTVTLFTQRMFARNDIIDFSPF